VVARWQDGVPMRISQSSPVVEKRGPDFSQLFDIVKLWAFVSTCFRTFMLRFSTYCKVRNNQESGKNRFDKPCSYNFLAGSGRT
jgi:hypothetical protein